MNEIENKDLEFGVRTIKIPYRTVTKIITELTKLGAIKCLLAASTRDREICRQLQLTKKELLTLLNKYKIIIKEVPPDEKVIALSKKALKFGVSPEFCIELGDEVFRLLQGKLYSMRGNAANVANFIKDPGVPFVQISSAELLQIFLGVATFSFPELNKKEALLKVLEDGKKFMLVRKNTALPYTKDNTVVMSSEQFGSRFGKTFGVNTLHQISRGIKPKGVKNISST